MRIRVGRSRSTLFFLASILLLTAFCGSPAIFAGESEWVEVKSPNFSVVTDAGEKRGREAAMRFEQMRAVFGALMTKGKVTLPVPLQIVAFRNTKELRQVAPLFNGKPVQLAGLFQGGSDRSFIMLDMSVENPWAVVFHEYAHQLMNGNLEGSFAPWFEEGFAEYFSSIEVDGKEAHVGKIPDYTYMTLQQAGTMKIADLLRVEHNSKTYNESGDHRTSFYAQSAILMHYIYDNQLMPKVAVYFDATENKHMQVEDAIQKAFGMSSAQFDKTLYSYAASGRSKYYRLPAPAGISPKDFAAIPLSATDSKTVLADIHLHSRDYQEQALGEFQALVKSDPNNAAAARGLGYAYLQRQDFSRAGQSFKQASQLNSKDPRVHYYSALLISRESGFSGGADLPLMTRELETSIQLDPNFADSYALLSFAQSSAGNAPEAIETLRKALAISPRNESYLFNLANLYMADRQTDKATAVLQSLRASASPEFASRAADMLANLHRFQEIRRADVDHSDEASLNGAPKEASVSVAAPVQSGPAKFIMGRLKIVDCSAPPIAVLTVTSGTRTFKMKVADTKHVILIGTDEFSCAWSGQKVSLNYRETSEGEGNVISLEIQ